MYFSKIVAEAMHARRRRNSSSDDLLMLSSVLKPLARRSRQQSQKLSRQRRRFRRRRSLFQSLEDRRLLASFSVVDLTDSGDGTCDGNGCTLRDAVLAANASFGEDTITFAPGLAFGFEVPGR